MTKLNEQLLDQNKQWVKRMLDQDPDFFNKLSEGQTPPLVWIGCSDSRVPANEITGTKPGDVFVHRNIANMVVNTDTNMLSVLFYAITALKVKHVIVCGHYGCGGVIAAMTDKSFGMLDNWLSNIKDVYRLHKAEVDAITDPGKRHRRMVELNVQEQVYNVLKVSFVQEAIRAGELQVHGWVYDIADGYLKDLEVGRGKGYDEIEKIYEVKKG